MKTNKPKGAPVTRRAQLEAERATLAPAAAEASTVPRLEATFIAARQTNCDYRQSPEYLNAPSGNRKAIELSSDEQRAREEFNRVRDRAAAAVARIREIDLLLAAPAEVARLTAELDAIATEGAKLEARDASLAELGRNLADEVAADDDRQKAARTALADERVAALLSGLDPPNVADRGSSAAVSQTREDLAAIERHRSQIRERLVELVKESAAAANLLTHARRRAAQIALEEIVVAHWSTFVDAKATADDRGFGPTSGMGRGFGPSDIEVERRREELSIEPWRPTIRDAEPEQDPQSATPQGFAA